MRYGRPYFQKYPGNLTFSLFLTECSVTDRIFTIRLSFFGRKSIREYFMSKSGIFTALFGYVGESRILNNPITRQDYDNKNSVNGQMLTHFTFLNFSFILSQNPSLQSIKITTSQSFGKSFKTAPTIFCP